MTELRFAINLLPDLTVVTRYGEFIGTWDTDETDAFYEFMPDGAGKPLSAIIEDSHSKSPPGEAGLVNSREQSQDSLGGLRWNTLQSGNWQSVRTLIRCELSGARCNEGQGPPLQIL